MLCETGMMKGLWCTVSFLSKQGVYSELLLEGEYVHSLELTYKKQELE